MNELIAKVFKHIYTKLGAVFSFVQQRPTYYYYFIYYTHDGGKYSHTAAQRNKRRECSLHTKQI